MFRRLLLGAGASTLALAMSTSIALAGNPAGTGQPSVECGDPGAELGPSGFDTGGFEVAESLYANDESTGGLSSGNGQVVSQYDVACFQFTTQHQ
jgi:hypothetical protein